MTAASNIGNDFKFQLGDDNSPVGFSDFAAVFNVGEIGEESPLIDITTLLSDAREYRVGLPDGVEIPLECNFKQGDTQVRALYTAFKNNTLKTFRLIAKDSPQDTWTFSAIVRGWKQGVQVGERSAAMFTLKISGSVTWDEA